MTGVGTLTRDDDGFTIRHVIELSATPDVVWTALTEPARLAQWLADATFDPVLGGHVEFTWPGEGEMHGVVEEIDPPRRLRYSWTEHDDTSHLVFDIEKVTAATSRLTLTHRAASEDDAPGFGAGWQSHLESLAAVLSGERTSKSIRDGRYEELRPRYDELLDAL